MNPAEGSVKFVESYTNEVGADGIIITASNKSNKIIAQAANMCRKKGRIILVGVIGLDIRRADFYKKNYFFKYLVRMDRDRYDENYEQKGSDYPIAYVRWTEKRNFEAILKAIAQKKLNVKPLITQSVNLADYQKIYGDIKHSNAIASIINYTNSTEPLPVVKITQKSFEGKKGVIGILGLVILQVL